MKQLFYTSTRDNKKRVLAHEAIIKGIADDGGLYVPTSIPQIEKSIEELASFSYQELAKYILGLYLTDYTKEEIADCVDSAYDSKFDDDRIAPVVKVDGTYVLELFHGKTIAFKDMALSILPHLMRHAKRKSEQKSDVVILTATSGDTGKAALEGFKDVPGFKIIVFYPKNGVSEIQERQMLTTTGDNTYVVGINGNFDDAQTSVKKIFSDQQLANRLKENDLVFSSANSINIGRLLPQIIYYVYSYLQVWKDKQVDSIDVVVPTGNFGNILAGYYAKLMGINIRRLISASNKNQILYDFLTTGEYDANRNLHLTTSPSMDILISSNLERLLFELNNNDSSIVANLMNELNENRKYKSVGSLEAAKESFGAGYASEAEVLETIKDVFDNKGYLLDPHTAVAYKVYEKVKKDDTATVVVSTASPYKFTRPVMEAVSGKSSLSDFVLLNNLCELSKVAIPAAVDGIDQLPVLHDTVVDKEDIGKIVEEILEL